MRTQPACLCVAILIVSSGMLKVAACQEVELLPAVLSQRIVSEDQTLDEVRRFVEARIAPLPEFSTALEWQTYAEAARQRVLEQVVFRGVAGQWRDAETAVEMRELVEPATAVSGSGVTGYRIRKLRLEVLPNLWIPGLLYLPEKVSGKVPVFLNVNGHDGAGKAAEYKQARCIHMARHGIIALNLEWFGMGQLAQPGYSHGRMNQLDLCGASGLAPFYLAMSRALDLLLSLENADPERVGVAGLSGGGWQTILISSLDTRVTLCNPVAGYSSFRTRIHHLSDLGDSEQTPVDLGLHADYAHLTALLAPRAALLTYNDKDNCCFASGHALAPLAQAAQPVYHLSNAEQKFRTYVNSDPGTHNFLLDNRQALYRMIRDQWYGGDENSFSSTELPLERELRTAEQLNVALPEPNLTFNTLASSLAESLPKAEPIPTEAAARLQWLTDLRQKLRSTVKPIDVAAMAEQIDQSTVGSMQIVRWKLKLGDVWTVPVIELSTATSEASVLLLHDQGRAGATERIAALLSSGHRVFVMDAFYFGDSSIAARGYLWALLVSTVGERPLGVQSGQTAAVARWIRETKKVDSLKLVSDGPRSGVIGLVTAALNPSLISSVEQHQPLESLKLLLLQNYSFEQAPELFCFGLLETADIPQLKLLADEQ